MKVSENRKQQTTIEFFLGKVKFKVETLALYWLSVCQIKLWILTTSIRHFMFQDVQVFTLWK